MLFRSENHRWRTVVLHGFALIFMIFFAPPVMWGSSLLHEATGIPQSVTALSGGAVFAGLSYLCSYLVGRAAYPEYFKGD
jgi:hypothetical protein